MAFFSRGHATLHLAVSVGRSFRRSVGPSVHHIFAFQVVLHYCSWSPHFYLNNWSYDYLNLCKIPKNFTIPKFSKFQNFQTPLKSNIFAVEQKVSGFSNNSPGHTCTPKKNKIYDLRVLWFDWFLLKLPDFRLTKASRFSMTRIWFEESNNQVLTQNGRW